MNRAPSNAGGAAPRRFRIAPRLLAIVLAVLSVTAILLYWRRPAPDPLARISVTAASDSATALFEAKRFSDALPYFRRLERIGPQNSYLFHARFAASLQNAAIESRIRDGRAATVSRSTVERVADLKEALVHLDRAETLAPSDQQRGDVACSRAWMLGLWGFWRESYVEFQRANRIRPLLPEERSEAAWVEAMLRDPTQTLAAPGAP